MDDRTQAARPRYYAASSRTTPSTSASSKFPYSASFLNSTLLKEKEKPSIIDCCKDDFCLYDLSELGEQFHLKPQKGDSLASAEYCKRLLNNILLEATDCDIVVESVIPRLEDSTICELFCSKCQKPDLYLKIKGEEIAQIVIEICSSPYEDTIRKCILVAVDLLRLRTMFNKRENKVLGYCFAKLPPGPDRGVKKLCVVKVEVCWNQFAFFYKLIPLKTQQSVKESIQQAVASLRELSLTNLPELRKTFVLQLSTEDLQQFGNGAFQFESRNSILIKSSSENKMYKFPLDMHQYYRMSKCCHMLSIVHRLASINTTAAVINLSETEVLQRRCFTYQCLPHNPLTCSEARQCLINLYSDVCAAIHTLHDNLHLAHLDIRLDNICFDQQYKPVFIDIDRAESRSVLPSLLGSSESCMYDTTKSCIGNDWMQFGWMLAWILEPSTTGSYHERECLMIYLPNSRKIIYYEPSLWKVTYLTLSHLVDL